MSKKTADKIDAGNGGKTVSLLLEIDEIRDRAAGSGEFVSSLARVLKGAFGAASAVVFLAEDGGALKAAAGEKSSGAARLAARALKDGKAVVGKGGEAAAAPMVVGRKAVGAIAIEAARGKAFGAEDLEMLSASARLADSAIEHKRAEEIAARRLRELSVITEIDRIRDTTEDARGILSKSLDVICRHIGADYAAAYTYSERKDALELVAERQKKGAGGAAGGAALDAAKKAVRSKKDVVTGAGARGAHGYALPIVLGEHDVFGALSLIRKSGAFSDDDKALLAAMEDQLDTALDHVRVFNSLVLKNKELGVLYHIDEIRDRHLDFDEMLSEVLAELVAVVDARAGFIVLFDLDGNERVMKTLGQVGAAQKSALRKISAGAIRSGKMFSGAAGPGLASVLCTPLILGERIIGTFGVVQPKNKKEFDIDDERLLRAVASQADTAIFEDLSRQKIKDVFKRYVNEKVVEQMLKAKKENFLSGQRLNMSVLFADMRGFTAMSEKIREPEKLVAVINEYLADMTEVVMKNDGTLDKFVGDEVMALFGAPLHYPGHAKTAIRTAIEMQRAMDRLCKKWKREGKIPCRIGIGINTGDMVAGNIGCEKVTSYTVLGDNVNLGARLCSAAKPDQILLAEATYLQAKGAFKFNELEPIMVKGKSKPIRIYEVVY